MITKLEVETKGHGLVAVSLETPPNLAGLIEAYGEEAVYKAALAHWANRVSASLRGQLRSGKPLDEAVAAASQIPMAEKPSAKIADKLAKLLERVSERDARAALAELDAKTLAKLGHRK